MLFPNIHQLVMRKNSNYLNSVWIGITAPLLNLPTIVWHTLALPVLRGIAIIGKLCSLPVLGILGILSSENVTVEQAFKNALSRMNKR